MKGFEDFYFNNIANHYNSYISFNQQNADNYKNKAWRDKEEFERRMTSLCCRHKHDDLALLYVMDMEETYKSLTFLAFCNQDNLSYEVLELASMYILYTLIAIPFVTTLEKQVDVEQDLDRIYEMATSIPDRNELVQILGSYGAYWRGKINEDDGL